MYAKITARNGYRCAPDGVTVLHFAFDEIVDGLAAEWAVADGYAQPFIETKPAEALETKPARIGKARK
jgi:hypothetical protein